MRLLPRVLRLTLATGIALSGRSAASEPIRGVGAALPKAVYAEWARVYARTKMQNREGEFVSPNIVSFQAAAANAPWESAAAFGLLLGDVRGRGSWPLTAPVFALVPHASPRIRPVPWRCSGSSTGPSRTGPGSPARPGMCPPPGRDDARRKRLEAPGEDLAGDLRLDGPLTGRTTAYAVGRRCLLGPRGGR
jgi:hypothetical protein